MCALSCRSCSCSWLLSPAPRACHIFPTSAPCPSQAPSLFSLCTFQVMHHNLFCASFPPLRALSALFLLLLPRDSPRPVPRVSSAVPGRAALLLAHTCRPFSSSSCFRRSDLYEEISLFFLIARNSSFLSQPKPNPFRIGQIKACAVPPGRSGWLSLEVQKAVCRGDTALCRVRRPRKGGWGCDTAWRGTRRQREQCWFCEAGERETWEVVVVERREQHGRRRKGWEKRLLESCCIYHLRVYERFLS